LRAVGGGGVGAGAGSGIADAGVVALIEGDAGDGIATRAGSRDAGVKLSAEIAVVAWRAVGGSGIRAGAGGGIAYARVMTLVGGGADDGDGADAGAIAANICPCAEVAIIAWCAIGRGGIRAQPGGGITDAGVVALVDCRAGDGVATGAGSSLAGIRQRACIAVVTGGSVG